MGLTRKQIKEGLDQIPIDRVLGVTNQLTPKMKKFAAEVAAGESKAESYRRAYKPTATKRTLASKPYELARDARIQREIEYIKLANERAKHRTAGQLRELVIQSLVEVVIDPEAKHSEKISAARVLGTVTEVSAFTTRTESKVIVSSANARDQIIQQLRDMMKAGATDAIEIDAAELLQELTPTLDDAPPADPTDDPMPLSARQESQDGSHTIPLKGIENSLKQSQKNEGTPQKNPDSYNAR